MKAQILSDFKTSYFYLIQKPLKLNDLCCVLHYSMGTTILNEMNAYTSKT